MLLKNASSNVTRRGFLAGTGAGLAAAGLGEWVVAQDQSNPDQLKTEYRPEPRAGGENPWIGKPVSQTAVAQDGQPTVQPEPPKKLGIAVLGLGKFTLGQILPGFAESKRCKVTGLISGDLDKAQAIAKNFNVPEKNCYKYEDFKQVADNAEIDVVYVVTPNALHEEWVIKAAEAGKHVLCEKPMATTVDACQRMIDACEKAGRKLMIAYRVHYEPYNRTMIEWSRQKKFGPIQLISSNTVLDVGGPNQWRCDVELSGGGSLFDIGIYSLNAMRYLTGEEPVEINAMMHSDPNDPRFRGELEQSLSFQLRFPSGIVTNSTSSFSTFTKNEYVVMCEKGWYGLDPATSYTGLRGFYSSKEQENEIHQLDLPQVHHVAAEMDAFADCIASDKPVATGGQMGLLDVKYMRLIYDAARQGKTLRVT